MTAPVLTSMLDRESPDAKARFAHNKALATDLREHVAKAALGVGESDLVEAAYVDLLAGEEGGGRRAVPDGA